MSAALLLRALNDWIAGRPPALCPAEADPAALRRLAKRNRMEPLLGVCLGDATTEAWLSLKQSCERAHRHCLARTLRHQAAAVTIGHTLDAAAIPHIGMRGLFADAEFYGNEGRRFFTDLDLLVPERAAPEALRALRAVGYELQPGALPEWFYRRHHLHWPLLHRATHIACDVHWAIDHPYSLRAVDVHAVFLNGRRMSIGGGVWRRPGPAHALLIQAVHLAKEDPAQAALPADTADFAGHVLETGSLITWLDFVLMLKAYGPTLDWSALLDTCADWRLLNTLSAALRHCAALGPEAAVVATPGEAALRRRVSRTHPGAGRCSADDATDRRPAVPLGRLQRSFRTLGNRGGFRAIRTADALRFLWPPEDYFRGRHRVGRLALRANHTLLASLKLTRVLLDGLVCAAMVRFRPRRRRGAGPRPRARDATPRHGP